MNVTLIVNVLLLYAILIVVNVPAAALGLEFEDGEGRRRLRFEPPGFVIPLAWFVLFALLGIARYDITRKDPESPLPWFIIGLAVLCASYAYYTLGLSRLTGVSALWFGLVGNLIVVVAALAVAYTLLPISSPAAALVVPVAVWTLYATAIVVGEMRVQGLL